MQIMNYHYPALESTSESILERFMRFLNKIDIRKDKILEKSLFDKLFYCT